MFEYLILMSRFLFIVATAGVTAGQLLCGGLLSREMTNNWFASICLSHTLLDNVSLKDNLLKVQLAIKANSPHTTLMNHVILILQQACHYKL